ncbi:MAG: helix-turn-helix transcriptional regulator [Epulopiscium sp.]|nr:helix-turn-helix transcriptional regulator [Candidatus Epulonipiscium sp.]
MRLKETIQNNQETLKTKFLRDLMYGILSKQQAEEQIDQYDLKQFQGSNTIIILQYMIDPELKENISAEGAFAIKKQIFSWVQHDLKGKVKAEMFELDDKRSILIIPEKDVDRIKRELNEMLLRAEELFAMNIIAVIGTPVDSIYQISDSFRSALNLLEYQFIWENHLIITDDDLKEFKNEMYYYPLDMERMIIEHVLKGRKDVVNQFLERILEENLINRNLGPDTLSQFIFAIVATSNRIIHQMITVDKQVLEQKEINYIELKMSESKEQLKQKIMELFEGLVEQCVQEAEKREDTIIDDIIVFIKQNYDTDLSLTDIAEEFNLSAGYVGILFKKSTGEKFKDYLNMYKVEKAKEILEHEDIKIKDLAKQVGCNTTNTFIRMFKRYVGISPGQYSDQVKEIRKDKKNTEI